MAADAATRTGSPNPRSRGLRRLVPAGLRRSVVDRLDPAAASRGETLVQRRLRGGGAPSGSASATAADSLRDAVLKGLTRSLRDGRTSPADVEQLTPLVKAYLEAATAARDVDPALTGPVSNAFEALYRPGPQPAAPPEPAIERVIVDQFQRLYYHTSRRTWKDTWYRGTQIYKSPTDMWVYGELIHTVRPGLIIETGTYRGASAQFFADHCETAGFGRVVTVDVEEYPDRPQHPRLTYLSGSSVAPETLATIREMLPDDDSPVLVILDSDHSQAHVAAELDAYAPLVTVGSYLIVEDTNINGHPVAPDYGPGPWEAVHDFLAARPGFQIDKRSERYGLTQNPDGYLRRTR